MPITCIKSVFLDSDIVPYSIFSPLNQLEWRNLAKQRELVGTHIIQYMYILKPLLWIRIILIRIQKLPTYFEIFRAGERANFLAAPASHFFFQLAPAPWQNILFPAN